MPAFKTRPSGRTWKKRRPAASTRDDVVYAEDSARMAHVVAGMRCPSCGTSVLDDNLHDRQCPDVPVERRRAA